MKPFLQGRKSLSIAPLRLPAGMAPQQVSARGASREPNLVATAAGCTVDTIKEGDKVVRIVVTCTCGEHVEINCLYPAGS